MIYINKAVLATVVGASIVALQSCKKEEGVGVNSTPIYELIPGEWNWVGGSFYDPDASFMVDFALDGEFEFRFGYEWVYYNTYTSTYDTTMLYNSYYGDWVLIGPLHKHIQMEFDGYGDEVLWEVEKVNENELDVLDTFGYDWEFEK